MATATKNGVFQQENGIWGYRFSVVIDGKRISRLKTTDANGKKLTSKREATKARQMAIAAAHTEMKRKQKIVRKTVKEVYEEYCEKGRKAKAFNTCLKQDSMWKNHLCERFGKRFVDDISVAEVNDYLAELYYINGFSYMYVESFLKMFYLIFGQAYSRNYLDVDIYNKLCLNKGTKISMPKMKTEDDTDIVSFNRQELATMDEYFKGTNAETAYLLGKYCGLRINETYGLKWENIDLDKGTIYIDRQMQYQEKIIKLVSPKTINAKRIIYMNKKLKKYFTELFAQWEIYKKENAALWLQNQKIIEDIDGEMISSTELVNCLPDGKIQTVNSLKYHSKEIKSQFGIDFKYHHLRHTYGTRMAEMNTPTHLLCNQMGHGNIRVTQKYYLAVSDTGVEILQRNLNSL